MKATVFTPEMARFRADCNQKIRRFFAKRGVLEVETPVLSRGVSTDCHIDVFSADYFPYSKSIASRMFMQTSPEFHMKRLLAEGFGDIFQLARVFRNGEQGRFHNPEFTMLEWYRIGFSMEQLITETEHLCSELLGVFPVVKKRYRDIFLAASGLDPLVVSYGDCLSFCRIKNLSVPSLSSVTDLFQFIMAHYIEPSLPKNTLVFITHFPAQQATLAKLDPHDARVALRFEVYLNGVELGNGYEELADWQENKRRLEEENQKRSEAQKFPLPVDENFIEALRKGIPPCSGIAMGVDRLIMFAAKLKCIGDVIAFDWERC
jgi:lysyl-tRNA synthetase class 2